jgi:hypothetical protein
MVRRIARRASPGRDVADQSIASVDDRETHSNRTIRNQGGRTMQIMKAGVLATILAGSVSVAQAATCYRSDEIEADQAVRLQAQIMVLSDSCHSDSYGEFRAHIGQALAAYQQKMIGHFRREGASARGADSAFDSFITALANKMALTYGNEPVGSLCPRSANFLAQAGHFSQNDFVHYVSEQAAANRQTYAICKDEAAFRP